jgi:type II restriction/modification system DNA methylase subunit YeeA
MELHGYLDHGYRVLSHPDGRERPEILDHAPEIDLPGLDREKAVELALDGTKDEELYRLLLTAQCNALHQAMPFLFEKIGDETEMLLPANLLHSDSLIRKLVEEIDEASWAEIEIIGWLYQFYISEKKDQVIGKVVKSEDIPAATQLFTPNWIVKYMVQNSLGAQWLATYPESPLKGQMEYYIEPAEQTDEVKAQLAAITPENLNPEELTLIDPASGSGHILVKAYELFKAFYLERGYRQRDVPQLILEKNLFGLDIDERAAQLTGFALMMKGRADDRRLFERGVKLNVMALVNSAGLDAEGLAKGVKLADYGVQPGDLTELKRLFEHATTFGSLIQVPERLAERLAALKQLGEATNQDLFVSDALRRLGPLVRQAELLAALYDAVVANPPYMGKHGMNGQLKKFAKAAFPDASSDLYACFMGRGYSLATDCGHVAMVTMQGWMFLSSFEKMRETLLREKTISTMAHLGSRAFGSISGEIVQTTAFALKNHLIQGFRPAFLRLLVGGEDDKRTALANGDGRFDGSAQNAFRRIPGSPIGYWVSDSFRGVFSRTESIGSITVARQGLVTAANELFVRLWFEVSFTDFGRGFADRESAAASGKTWFPYNKGGAYRKWYGNSEHVVNWAEDGAAIKEKKKRDLDAGRITANNSQCWNQDYYFKPSVSWSGISSNRTAFRKYSPGSIFSGAGLSAFFDADLEQVAIAGLNSSVFQELLELISPGLSLTSGELGKMPFLTSSENPRLSKLSSDLICAASTDWNAFERSWDFQSLPLLTASSEPTPTLEASYTAWTRKNCDTISEMKRLEEVNNRLFIDTYGLQAELNPDVPIEQITLTVNPAYRYGGNLTEEEQWNRFREDTMQELVSYAIGCMMGRYSLDEPGLIYAHSGNEGFDRSRYATFPADEDGIIPLTDTDWFADDAAHRLIEFLSVAWDKADLEENLAFLAENLSPRKNESSRDTVRRYLSDNFFKDHLQTYKRRPIYWLFSSGKQRAFQALVYLHRYNEGTLARMRTEYVVPLQGMITTRIERLGEEIEKTNSTAQRKKLEKERDRLLKQRPELQEFDEKLRHYADMRIALDLDDGVKVNYGKFGDLLAEVKSVIGGDED